MQNIEQKSSGLHVEDDFLLLYNPERIYEGRATEDIEMRYPAVIAGAGPKLLTRKRVVFTDFQERGNDDDKYQSCETEKLFEGVYRDVNTALSNELAKFCEKIGVDFWEVREMPILSPIAIFINQV